MEQNLKELERLSMKDRIVYGIVIATMLAAFGMIFTGMFTAPKGEIHDSVLIAYGLALLFVATMLGIIKFATVKLTELRAAIPVLVREAVKEEKEEATR